ncbi:MAG TPA: ribonuclease III [Steroidobacteraceae bacterium]|jgi:ribonuclease-3|nr:ribonuclease III [Steroidobacteraceae bacterium]
MPQERAEGLRRWLRDALGYEAVDLTLFETALTHRSADGPNNERLEFLGDAVLGLVCAQYLYERFGQADEGALSRLRASVVNGESLAQLAAGLSLGEQLSLGPGELKTGGFRRESILADALEALCGALYLDAGLPRAGAMIEQLLAPALQGMSLPADLKDPKTRLQELLQGRGLPLPRYSVDNVEGELHAQVFRVTCEVEPLALRAGATGSSRRRAEQVAAARILEQIQADS